MVKNKTFDLIDIECEYKTVKLTQITSKYEV